jgi:putative flippase GtrA
VQVLRFLLVGVLNTGVGLAFIFGAMAAGVDYRWANALGYALGCLVGFAANRSWTFGHEGPWRSSLARWLLVVAVAYASNLALVVTLHGVLRIDAYVAQLAGVVLYTAVAFLGARGFAFRTHGAGQDGTLDTHG